MKTHPKFPEYVAVIPSEVLEPEVRRKVFGQGAEPLCFDCPSKECRKGAMLCPITGIWLHVANVTKLRLTGYDVMLDTSEKTVAWKGD